MLGVYIVCYLLINVDAGQDDLGGKILPLARYSRLDCLPFIYLFLIVSSLNLDYWILRMDCWAQVMKQFSNSPPLLDPIENMNIQEEHLDQVLRILKFTLIYDSIYRISYLIYRALRSDSEDPSLINYHLRSPNRVCMMVCFYCQTHHIDNGPPCC